MTDGTPPPKTLFVLRWALGGHRFGWLFHCGACAKEEWLAVLLVTSTATLTVLFPDGTATELTATFLE